MEPVIYFNRAFRPEREATVSVRSRALNYGLGCFAGIRGYKTDDGRQVHVFRLDRHVRRLEQSARILRLRLPGSPAEVADVIVELLRRNDMRGDVYIRPIVFANSNELSPLLDPDTSETAIFCMPLGRYLSADPIDVCVSSWRRVRETAIPARAKATARVPEQRARPPRGDGQRLHGSDSADRRRPRVGGIGRARVHRARRPADFAAEHGRQPGRHHAPEPDHAGARRPRTSRSWSGRSGAPSCTWPTRSSCAGRAPRSRRCARSIGERSATARSGRSPDGCPGTSRRSCAAACRQRARLADPRLVDGRWREAKRAAPGVPPTLSLIRYTPVSAVM